MTPDDFRRIALSQPGAAEGAHMGHADFRVGGRIFATLGSPDASYGMGLGAGARHDAWRFLISGTFWLSHDYQAGPFLGYGAHFSRVSGELSACHGFRFGSFELAPCVLLTVDDVIYFKADSKYTRVVTATSEALIRKPLSDLQQQLDPDIFWQVHRSIIVNAGAIRTVHRSFRGALHIRLKERAEDLPVSAAHAHRFKQS